MVVEPLGGPNVVPNGGFEVDTAGWSTSAPAFWLVAGGTLTRITTDNKSGVACARIQAAAVNRGMAYALTLQAATQYVLSAWVKGTTNGGQLFIGEADGGTSQVLALPADTAGQWVQVTVVFTTAADTACVVGIKCTGTAMDMQVDDVYVQLQAYAPNLVIDGGDLAVITGTVPSKTYITGNISNHPSSLV